MTSTATIQPVLTAPSRWRGIAAWACAALLLLLGGYLGLALQHRLWDVTEPIRFRGDILNAYNQGWRAQQLGVFNVYRHAAEHAYERSDGSVDYALDYPPLRLIVAWLWSGWTTRHFGPTGGWQNTWEFHQPLLLMNRLLLATAALSAMGLVVHFIRLRSLPLVSLDSPWRGGRAGVEVASLTHIPSSRGLIPGALAALLVWFSLPANLIGFAWPQWDICVPAFFLAALLAGCRRCWILAGILLATGGMYKGQVLVTLPIFLLWPAVAGEWRGLLRITLGFALAAGVIAAPFMFQSTLWAVGTLAGVMLAIVGTGVLCRRSASRRRWLLIVTAAVAAWPASAVAGITSAILATLIAALLFILAATLPRRGRDLPSLIAFATASAIWLSACFTPEPWHWLHVGLLYGTHHFQSMIMGPASTFPAVLSLRFGIHRPDTLAFTITGHEITWKLLLRTIFLTGMVLCGIAMGIHHRRGNPRFLLAAITPWVLFATIPAQIHERYPMYPALASAVLIALGFRWTLLHLCLATISGATVLYALLASGQPHLFLPQPDGTSIGTDLQQIVRPLHPDIAWAMLVFCALCLWCALDLRRPTTLTETPAGTGSSRRTREQ